MLKVLFCGTAEFAVPALKALQGSRDVQLVGVITQPDRPAGRKQLLTPSPVKAFLLEGQNIDSAKQQAELKIFQPESLRKEAVQILDDTQPDLIVVVAYGQILPKEMIDYPRYKCLNIHGSLLPTYRGAVPIEMSLLNGDQQVGVSILQMTPGLDDGPVLAEKAVKVGELDDAATLRASLAEIGANLLLEILPKWLAGEQITTTQEDLAAKTGREVSYCKATDLVRDNAEITAVMSAEQALRKIRAFAAGSGAWLKLYRQGRLTELKIWKARVISTEPQQGMWGKFRQNGGSLELTLAGGKLEILEAQLAGKQRGTAAQYAYLDKDTDAQARVAVVVADELLVIKRQKQGKTYTVLPGGHLEQGESSISGALRELQEETGLTAKQSDLKQFFQLPEAGYFIYRLELKPHVQLSGEEMLRSNPENTYELAWIKQDSVEWQQIVPEELKPELEKLMDSDL